MLIAAIVLILLKADGQRTGRQILVFFNNIVPFYNPQASTPYSSLINCDVKSQDFYYFPSISDQLRGYTPIDSGIQIQYKVSSSQPLLCQAKLAPSQSFSLQNAIKEHSRIEIEIDGLPLWTPLGYYEQETESIFIYTHFEFTFYYNGDSIIKVNVEGSKRLDMNFANNLNFFYSVQWKPTEEMYENRFIYYLDSEMYETGGVEIVLWTNTIFVIFVCIWGICEINKNLNSDPHDPKNNEVHLWKLLENDMLNLPSHMLLFIGAISTGWHLLVTGFAFIITMIATEGYTKIGYPAYYFLLEYLLLSIVCGLASGILHIANATGKRINMISLIAFFFPFLLLLLYVASNCVSGNNSSFYPSLLRLSQYFFGIYVPMFFIGVGCAIVLSKCTKISNHATPSQKMSNLIKTYHFSTKVFMLAGGLFPFMSIYPSLYMILNSFYTYRIFSHFTVLLVSLFLLVISSGFIAICVTFLSLNQGNHRWQWISFGTSSSIGIYTFMHFLYFYLESEMSGYLQLFYYFIYASSASGAIGLTSGTIGYTCTSIFIQKIYSRLKFE